MIQDVDRSLEALLKLDLGNPLTFDISFAIPDDDFAPVSNARPTLNCYLYDIREDRDYRELGLRTQVTTTGTLISEPAPVRVQLSYCLTAWSPVQPAGGVSPASDEHQLLGRVLRVLLRYPEWPDAVLLGAITTCEPLPWTTVIVADPLKRAGEFWSAIQGKLRPSLDYTVTIPMPALDPFEGPLVTRVAATTALPGQITQEMTLVGIIVQESGPNPARIANAWVQVVETGRVLITGTDGTVVTERLPRGSYTIMVRAVGYQEGTSRMVIPGVSGPLIIALDPL